jgi:acyl carrier protein
MDVRERVISVIETTTGLSVGETAGDAVIKDAVGLDSLDEIEVLMALEEEFGLEIPDTNGEALISLDRIVDYCESRA